MKSIVKVVPIVLILSACSSLNPFAEKEPVLKLGQKMEVVQEPEKVKPASEKPLDKSTHSVASVIPAWFLKPPIQEGYIFGTGTSRSRDLAMAKEKAMTTAQGKIAESLGGKVSKQTKVFRTEAGSNVIESSNSLIKKTVSNVDFTGAEMRDVVVRLEENGYYRVYVLMTLPLGESNQVLKQQMDAALTREMLSTERAESKELEAVEKQNQKAPTPNKMLGEKPQVQNPVPPAVIVNPIPSTSLAPSSPFVLEVNKNDSQAMASLPHNNIKDQELKSRVQNIIRNNPDAVVLRATVQ